MVAIDDYGVMLDEACKTYGASSGTPRWLSKDWRQNPMSELPKMICDFCAQPEPTVEYPCADFTALVAPALTDISRGAWWACSDCAALVDSNSWTELATRAVNTVARPEEPEYIVLMSYTLALHRAFNSHRLARN